MSSDPPQAPLQIRTSTPSPPPSSPPLSEDASTTPSTHATQPTEGRTPPPTHPSRLPSARRVPPAPDTSLPAPALPSPRPRHLTPDPALSPGPSPSLSCQLLPSTRTPPAEDSYIRDPHRLIAYIVPFPTPTFHTKSGETLPAPPPRFLIYTPPPPPLLRPSGDGVEDKDGKVPGLKEGRTHKVQRKWQEEVRAAHESEHKVLSWGGIRARVTRGVDWAVGQVTTADLDFLVRVPKDGEVHHPHYGRSHHGSVSTPAAKSGGTATSGGTAADAAMADMRTALASADLSTPPPSMQDTEIMPTTTGIGSGAYAKEAEAARDSELHSAPPAYTSVDEPSAPLAPPTLPPRRSVDATSQGPATQPGALPIPLPHDEDPSHPESSAPTQATVKLDEMVLIYPPSLTLTPEELKAEFVNSLLRTKTKAQRDTIIATGLLPVSLALDWALVFVGWVFGGALEVDAVWLASSFRGAKTARSVTKRLSSSGSGELKLTFKPSHRVDLLEAYLRDKCVAADADRFENTGPVPSSYEVLDSIGWEAAGKYDAHNWEDERWERRQVEVDLSTTMGKAAGAWRKWCDLYEKDPEKALRR